MGQTLFGGESQQSTRNAQSSSGNLAFPQLSTALGGTIGNGGAAGSQIANLLGLNGGPAQNQGFTNFRNSTGYQFGLDQGLGAITGSAATNGLVNSGGTLKAMEKYGQDYANTQYQNYINPLQNLVNSGIQGAGVLSDAGKVSQSTDDSQSTGSKSPGMGGFIGTLLGK